MKYIVNEKKIIIEKLTGELSCAVVRGISSVSSSVLALSVLQLDRLNVFKIRVATSNPIYEVC